MQDSDLAELYNVETKTLNRAVKRNIERFPEEFMFRLTDKEWEDLRFQIGTLNTPSNSLRYQNGTLKNQRGKHRKYLPYVFTEQGVAMLSAVLRSETAVKVSIRIMEAFVVMRRFLINNAQIFQRIDTIEKRQLKHEMGTNDKFEKVFNALQRKEVEPRQGIFFNGQIFDAYKFVSGLVRAANKSILLIDNYVDETVLGLFSKKKKNVKVTIFTAKITNTLELDAEKFNAQYSTLELRKFTKAHDRFLIIDDKDVYHFGASLKDLGKKWFAFSKMDKTAFSLMENLKKVIVDE
jgi:phage regulator Rha-like protein